MSPALLQNTVTATDDVAVVGNGKMKPSSSPVPDLWITGIGSQYPPYLHPPENFTNFAAKFHDIERPVLKMLLKLTHNSGIETRACTMDLENGFGCQAHIPTVEELDGRFRKTGVDMTVQACRKALREWGGDPATEITHAVGVTICTQSAPGFPDLVARKLGLHHSVETVFLQGVGCAGSVALMRVAGELACAATIRKRPARILCFACELCSQYMRHQYAEAEASEDLQNIDIAGAIFGDAASAFILCNEYGLESSDQAQFQLLEWERAMLPNTMHHMGAVIKPTGFTSIISKDVPNYTRKAVRPLWDKLLPSYREKSGDPYLDISDFDWALHPGGEAIINGVKDDMNLTENQIRATRKIYRSRGNGGSPTLLCVLDLLRQMGRGKDHVVATTFGPGMACEMAFLRRCRDNLEE